MVKIQANSQGKAYLTYNNKVLVSNLSPNVVTTSLSITPTTSAQQITTPSGIDGYTPINVAAVTSSIDSNITASNIRNGVTILGVTGSYGDSINIPREVTAQGVCQMPSINFSFSLPSNVTDIGDYALANVFQGCTNLTSVDLSSLATVSGNRSLFSAFRDCVNLEIANFSALSSIVLNEYAFWNIFYGCTALTSISFPALTTVSGSYVFYQAFAYCTNLTSISFPALTTTSFGSNTNQFHSMMSNTGTSKIHTIHFPSNLESTISGLSGYPTFGGTSGKVTVSFDLPATS